jgi:hypothetical protein
MVAPYRPDAPIEFPPTTVDHHLRLLAVFYYVAGGLAALFSCMFIFHIVWGAHMLASPDTAWPMNPNAPGGAPRPPPAMGAMLVGLGCLAVAFGWIMGALTAFAGRSIAQRRRYVFCLVMAGLLCMWVPFGTILGVFTFVLLTKPQVRAQFEAHGRNGP